MVARLPPLNALRAFEAAGRLSSIRAAADEISVTPAAISQHIKSLETALGVKLFVRSHRAITLTASGERYLADISAHLSGIRAATANVMKRRNRRVLNIQAHATFAMRWLIPRLSSFHAAHPEIDVRLMTTLAGQDIDSGAIDGAIRLGSGKWKGLEAVALVPNELSPVCSPALLRQHPRIATADGLAQQTLLHSLARPDDWASWLKAARMCTIDADGGLKYESSVLAYQAAIEGQGIAIAQKALVDADIRAARLVYPFTFVLDMGAHTYYFAWPLDAEMSPALKTFKAWLMSEVSAHASASMAPRNPAASKTAQPHVSKVARPRRAMAA